ncbi:hypothetical protein [Agromyces sp. PvR057]|uniref:hypothetical protein n=1 Tax=Agromyces sp. PvR057 TaxID=3156403 RepID=UPI00339B45EB
MGDRSKSDSAAVWYFVAATFLSTAGVFVIVLGDGLMLLAALAFFASAGSAAAGVVVLIRDQARRRS